MSNKILFFGNERLATGLSTDAPVFQALLDAGYDIAALVVAQHELGASRQARDLEITAIAGQHGVAVISPDNLTDSRDELANFGAEAAVLIAYGKIVPQAIIDLFEHGIVNLHPALLPKHRGPTPIESVILNGEDLTGVSLMSLAAKMDSGPVYDQLSLPLKGDETKADLAGKLVAMGCDMLLSALPKILDGSLRPSPQDEAAATHDKKIEKADGKLDFTKPAIRLEREVRAYAGWPRSRTVLGSTEVIITRSHVETGTGQPGSRLSEPKKLGIYTVEDVLMIDSLIPAGKKEMTAEAFLAGHKR